MMTADEQQLLHRIAQQSILNGLQHSQALAIKLDDYAESLREQRATFVTLHIAQELRGCIGTLIPHRPLVEDIAHNAYAAAFSDPRFAPLQAQEFELLDYHLSILSPTSPMSFSSEEDLLRQIRPGIDGLILKEKHQQGTFLPSVWEQLPQKEAFWQQLKLKAGLATNYWSDSLQVSRYSVESF
ncbi:AmmeMemoRadiSam system protein A [sulfur-oxidizing endosymbiont of Gigantopelta aegis]|uniref:AmmeMemoRadiSam system protein A n=1 Tax=sulfur-oxidizing endosymbiont of Gigantopelta aegis TaxID=2794934 RepID=UPI0018DBEA65|nr:AmmeMemoRadiSam system protein A [sulfur-oxidizing endosymbiont of Gigantopelta aegis]